MSANLYAEWRKAVSPGDPLRICRVVAHHGMESELQDLSGGQRFRIQGTEYAVDARVSVQGDRVRGPVPELPDGGTMYVD